MWRNGIEFRKSIPHCGHPMEDVEIAPEVTNQLESQPEMTYQPIDSPSYNPRVRREPGNAPQPSLQLPQTELSLGTMCKMLMCLFSVVGIILVAVLCGKYKAAEEPSRDFMEFFVGYMFSFVGLYFFSRMFVQRNSVQQLLGFVVGFSAIFMEAVIFSYQHKEISRDMSMAVGIIFLLGLVSVMWYAGSKHDWSKIFFLIAGTLLLAGFSMIIGAGPEYKEMIIFAVLGSIGLFSMLVGWLVELTLQGNNSTTRFIALLEVVLILVTILIGAITLKTILNEEADFVERFNKLKLTMIFLMISGASSVVFSLFLPRKRFLFFMSVLFLAVAMLMTLGHYRVFKVEAARFNSPYDLYYRYYYDQAYEVDRALRTQTLNLLFAGMFLFPISILMSYVADMTKGITSKLSFKIQ